MQLFPRSIVRLGYNTAIWRLNLGSCETKNDAAGLRVSGRGSGHPRCPIRQVWFLRLADGAPRLDKERMA